MTPSGQRFYEKAKELLRLSYQFEQNSKADNELVSGIISIGCFETAAPLYMPSLMAGFKKIYPEITIKIYDGEQHEIAHGLHRGRFDWLFSTTSNWIPQFIPRASTRRRNPMRCYRRIIHWPSGTPCGCPS